MSQAPDDFQGLIQGLLTGESWAVREFCDRYGEALERIGDQRRVGSDDRVQLTCGTFYRRTRTGEFQLPDVAALWRLLSARTLIQAREQAQRRLSREDATPTAAEFADQLEQLIDSLGTQGQLVLDLKLQDLIPAQIAERLGLRERAVRRIQERVRRGILPPEPTL